MRRMTMTMTMTMTAEQHFNRALDLEREASKAMRDNDPLAAKFYGGQMLEHLKRAAAKEKE